MDWGINGGENEDTKSTLLSIEVLLRLKGNEHMYKYLEGNTDSRKEFGFIVGGELGVGFFWLLLVEWNHCR